VFELPRFIYTNPTGLNEEKVDRLEGCLLDADVAVVTETHWKNDKVIDIPNFKTYCANRQGRGGGGVAGAAAIRRGPSENSFRLLDLLVRVWFVAEVQRSKFWENGIDARLFRLLGEQHHDFAGCIPGCHEILRRQGLLEGRWCLDPHEELSPGQMEEVDRVCRAYPHLQDDTFVQEHLDDWLR